MKMVLLTLEFTYSIEEMLFGTEDLLMKPEMIVYETEI